MGETQEIYYQTNLFESKQINKQEGQVKFAIYDCLYELNEGIDPNKNDDIDVQVLIDIICNISNLNIEEMPAYSREF